jgi:hypothetical protein
MAFRKSAKLRELLASMGYETGNTEEHRGHGFIDPQILQPSPSWLVDPSGNEAQGNRNVVARQEWGTAGEKFAKKVSEDLGGRLVE